MKYLMRTSNDVAPDMVGSEYGNHKSEVIQGVRYWEFENEGAADRFKAAARNGAFCRDGHFPKLVQKIVDTSK